MAEKIQELETLLADLDDRDYDALILLLQLKSKGWNVHNVIDADLVGNYCFPGGIMKPRVVKYRELTEEYITDEQITLYDLFKNSQPEPQGIILDEYVIELRGMTRVGKAAEQSSTNVATKFVNEWLEKSRRNIVNIEELTEDVINNFASRLAEVFFGIDGLSKFGELMNEKLLKFESGEQLPTFFQELFDEETEDDAEAAKILNVFWSKETQFNTNSRERDSIAIQRIIGLNKAIQNKTTASDQKNLLVFVIDAPSVTQGVFEELYRSKDHTIPIVDGRPLPLYLTTQQIFAHLICKVTDSSNQEDYRQTILKLEKLKEVASHIKDTTSSTQNRIGENNKDAGADDLFTGEYHNFFANYKLIRNAFENTGIFKNLNDIYNDIKIKLKDRKASYLINYFKEVQEKEKEILSSLKDRDKYLSTLIGEIDFNTLFIQGIEDIHDEKTGWQWSKGVDHIEGTYQILPVFIQLQNYDKFSKEINKVIRLVLGDEQKDDHNVYDAVEKMIEKLKTTRSQGKYLMSSRLLKALIFLLLPDHKGRESNKAKNFDKDSLVLKWLQFVEKSKTVPAEYAADLKYMLCWIHRRLNDITESIKYAKEGIRNYPEDPRFYHGYALGRYCKLFEDKLASVKDYDEIIKDLQKAEELYQFFFERNYNASDTKHYMDKLRANNNNSICVLLTEKAEIFFEIDKYDEAYICLKEARAKLEKLKNRDGFVTKLAEYYDTESSLEYQESFLEEDHIDPVKKLDNAHTASKEARSLTSRPDLVAKYAKMTEKIRKRLIHFRPV